MGLVALGGIRTFGCMGGALTRAAFSGAARLGASGEGANVGVGGSEGIRDVIVAGRSASRFGVVS